SFWIGPFQPLGDKIQKAFPGADKIETLLDHDLKNLLNERIKRFSVLEDFTNTQNGVEGKKNPSFLKQASHIHIYGHYALRLEENKDWVIQITPLIRIGPQETPATLASPIKFVLDSSPKESSSAGKEPASPTLSTGDYKQILERVYSRVSTEVYARIEED